MMKMLRICLLGLIAAGFAFVRQGTDELLRMLPAEGVSGTWGTWTFDMTVGSTPIETGGSLRVQLPYVWHAYYRNSPHALQSVDQFAPNYVSARSSNPDVRLSWEVEGDGWTTAINGMYVKHRKPAIDGREHRYAFVVRVTVESGQLASGDLLSVIYGDTSEGSPGFYGPVTAPNTEPVLVAVDYNGNGKYRVFKDTPHLTAVPGIPVELVATLESIGVAGEPAELHLSFLDLNYNGAQGPDRRVRLQVVDGVADVPEVILVDGNRAWADIMVVPETAGILRILAVSETGDFTALSNPMKVSAAKPEHRLYWGDLHSHANLSWDGVGKDYFPYARNLSDLDFYALTDHANGDITEEDMQALAEDVRRWYQPNKFATILAYECSYGRPYGHHNIFFRGTEVGFFTGPRDMILPDLLKNLREGYAFAVPHGLNHDPQYEKDPRVRLAEIYSLWGTSELDDQADDLSYWKSDWKINRIQDPPVPSYPNPGYTQNLWRNGVRIGVIGSSDDHRGRPGKRRGGIAAVYAPELTREGIFDALVARHAYATTGDRILLDFAVNGDRQGAEIMSSGSPKLHVEAHGTDRIAWLEVLKLVLGEDDYTVIHRVEPDAPDVALDFVDTDFRADALYYVRLRQKAYVRNRPVQAWSSPVWVEKR